MTEHSYRGRCLCGAVSYAFAGPVKWVGHCHCESCRRNAASPFTTFVSAWDRNFQWTGAAPKAYASSPGVERLFCPTCGTPVAYRATRLPGETHIYLAALEDPHDLTPGIHYFWKERVAWIPHPDDGLPHG